MRTGNTRHASDRTRGRLDCEGLTRRDLRECQVTRAALDGEVVHRREAGRTGHRDTGRSKVQGQVVVGGNGPAKGVGSTRANEGDIARHRQAVDRPGHHVDGAAGHIGRVRRGAGVSPELQRQIALGGTQAHIASGDDVALFGRQSVQDAAVGRLDQNCPAHRAQLAQRDVALRRHMDVPRRTGGGCTVAGHVQEVDRGQVDVVRHHVTRHGEVATCLELALDLRHTQIDLGGCIHIGIPRGRTVERERVGITQHDVTRTGHTHGSHKVMREVVQHDVRRSRRQGRGSLDSDRLTVTIHQTCRGDREISPNRQRAQCAGTQRGQRQITTDGAREGKRVEITEGRIANIRDADLATKLVARVVQDDIRACAGAHSGGARDLQRTTVGDAQCTDAEVATQGGGTQIDAVGVDQAHVGRTHDAQRLPEVVGRVGQGDVGTGRRTQAGSARHLDGSAGLNGPGRVQDQVATNAGAGQGHSARVGQRCMAAGGCGQGDSTHQAVGLRE